MLPQSAITARCLRVIGGVRLASSLGFEGMSEIKMLHQDMQHPRHDSSFGR